jgi:hypothetical protein
MTAKDTMSPDTISLAVWDVPMPVVVGGRFSIKVGAKSANGNALANSRVEVLDAAGTVVASGPLGATPLAGTEALAWTTLDLPAPPAPQIADYTVRLGTAATRFTVVAATKPEHTLTVSVTEQDSKAALAGVEIRLGPFHARTDRSGRAQLRVCRGEYRLELWRTAHAAPHRTITIDGDATLALTMVHVPEEHPDARWVR